MCYADIRGHHGKRWNYEPGDKYMKTIPDIEEEKTGYSDEHWSINIR